MTQDEIIEMAIQGHASTRDAIRWAMRQEREACARIADESAKQILEHNFSALIAHTIRARGEA